eukprot:1158650-Pelagomonas_calceolata.AAC.3
MLLEQQPVLPPTVHTCALLVLMCLVHFTQWKVKRRGDGALLGLYAGQSAIVTIHKRGCSATYNAGTVDWRDVGDANCTSLSTPFGPYALRTSVHGMEIWVSSWMGLGGVLMTKAIDGGVGKCRSAQSGGGEEGSGVEQQVFGACENVGFLKWGSQGRDRGLLKVSGVQKVGTCRGCTCHGGCGGVFGNQR